MKKSIIGFSLFLMLVQNGFSATDAEYNKLIINEPDKVWKQLYRCSKAANQHNRYTSDVKICLKAIDMTKKNPYVLKEGAKQNLNYLNTGIIYYFNNKDFIKAYNYWMKSADLGEVKSQNYLDVLCKEHPWVCK